MIKSWLLFAAAGFALAAVSFVVHTNETRISLTTKLLIEFEQPTEKRHVVLPFDAHLQSKQSFVTLKNRSKVVGAITILASCGCVDINPSELTIQPRQAVRINYQVRPPQNWQGDKTITLRAIDSDGELLDSISIRWTFQPPLRCRPEFVRISQEEAIQTAIVDVEAIGNNTLNDFHWSVLPANTFIVSHTIESPQNMTFKITTNCVEELGAAIGTIVLEHSETNYACRIPLTIQMQPKVVVTPSKFYVPDSAKLSQTLFIVADKNVNLGDFNGISPPGIIQLSENTMISGNVRSYIVSWDSHAGFSDKNSEQRFKLMFSGYSKPLDVSVVPHSIAAH